MVFTFFDRNQLFNSNTKQPSSSPACYLPSFTEINTSTQTQCNHRHLQHGSYILWQKSTQHFKFNSKQCNHHHLQHGSYLLWQKSTQHFNSNTMQPSSSPAWKLHSLTEINSQHLTWVEPDKNLNPERWEFTLKSHLKDIFMPSLKDIWILKSGCNFKKSPSMI